MENDLIIKLQKGDQNSFRIIYDSYSSYALRTAYAITRSKEDANDVVQETFIKIFKNIKNFNNTKSFKAWFYKILINECNNILRKRSIHIPIHDYIEKDNNLTVIDMYNCEEYELLYKAINQLREIYRLPIILKYLNDFTEKDLAEILEINISTVKSRLFNGRENLKKYIEKLEKEV